MGQNHGNLGSTALNGGRHESKLTRRSVLAAAPGALALAAIAAAGARRRKYDTGASDSEIKIGNTNPYSGPGLVLRHDRQGRRPPISR